MPGARRWDRRRRRTFPFSSAERFERGPQCGISGEGVVDLGPWRPGVPLVPDRGRVIRDGGGGQAALEAGDPWVGFRGYIEAAAELQVHDLGIADLITMDVSMAPEIETLRDQAFQGLVEVIERAKAAGALRADATPEDVLVILQANAGVVSRAHGAAGEASRRLVHLLVDGLRADAATPGPTAPSPRRMRAAMREHSRRAGLVHQPNATTSRPDKEHP